MANDVVEFNSGVPAAHAWQVVRSYNVYYVYADTDEGYLLKLQQHLQVLERKGLLHGWHRRKVTAGEDWQMVANQHFEAADIILLLVSPALLDSKYVYDTEVEQAMLRHARGKVVVVPVLMLPCMWELTPFENCAPLPSNADFVSCWGDEASAFLDIAQGIHDLILELRGEPCPGGRRSKASPTAMQRYAVRECVDRLEIVLAELAKVSGDATKTNELRAEMGAIDQFVRPVLQPKAGDLLAGMELLQPVGNGAFATVWLAKKPGPDTGERYAVKVLHQTCLTSGSMLWHFRRGVKAMKYLTRKTDVHPQIVPLLREDDSSLAFVMPFLPGQNLVNVKERGWSVEKKVEVLISICRTVEYAHRRKVVHRDIKPANIVFDGQGTPFLTDFDLADMETATTLSVADRGLGSPMFAAPEQIENSEKPDVRCDVYSLGRLLHYLLLERPLNVSPDHPADFEGLSKLPLPLIAIVRKAAARDPSKRYRDVASLRAALGTYRRRSSLVAAWAYRIGNGLQHWSALVALLLLGVATAGTFFYYDRFRCAQYRLLEERNEQLRAEIDKLNLDYAALASAQVSLSDEKQDKESQMVDLVDQYNRVQKDSSLDASSKKTLTAEIHSRWAPLQQRCDEITAKEAIAMREIQRNRDELEKKQIQLEKESLARGFAPPIVRKFDLPPALPALPTGHGVGALVTGEETPKPFAFSDLEPRLAAAATQVAEHCRVPAGAATSGSVAVTILSSGAVSAVMVSGPKNTEAELCVVALYAAIRVEENKARSTLVIPRQIHFMHER
jgi:serine/threonine protein kinase